MFRTLTTILTITLLCLSAGAQEKKPEEAKKSKTAVPSGYLRVQVVLSNEAVFHGVVDKKRMVEKMKRFEYVTLKDDQKSDFGAGIRLWFYDGLAGFLFFRYRQVEKVVVERELSVVEFDELKAQAKELLKAKQASLSKSSTKTAAAKKPADAGSGLDAESRKMLEAYPPSEGWSEEKFADIQKRVITESYEPTAEEAAWTKVYPDWLKALRKSKAPAEKPAEKKVRPPAKDKAKLVAQPKAPSVTPKPGARSGMTTTAKGRIKLDIKRGERKGPEDTSGAKRSIR